MPRHVALTAEMNFLTEAGSSRSGCPCGGFLVNALLLHTAALGSARTWRRGRRSKLFGVSSYKHTNDQMRTPFLGTTRSTSDHVISLLEVLQCFPPISQTPDTSYPVLVHITYKNTITVSTLITLLLPVLGPSVLHQPPGTGSSFPPGWWVVQLQNPSQVVSTSGANCSGLHSPGCRLGGGDQNAVGLLEEAVS